LNEPDAFPSGDLVLKRMAGGCTSTELERRSEPWRPWRAYAVMLLWQSARDFDAQQRRTRHAHVEVSLHPRRSRDRGIAAAGGGQQLPYVRHDCRHMLNCGKGALCLATELSLLLRCSSDGR
jgi:hypothetical protein